MREVVAWSYYRIWRLAHLGREFVRECGRECRLIVRSKATLPLGSADQAIVEKHRDFVHRLRALHDYFGYFWILWLF